MVFADLPQVVERGVGGVNLGLGCLDLCIERVNLALRLLQRRGVLATQRGKGCFGTGDSGLVRDDDPLARLLLADALTVERGQRVRGRS